MQYVEFEQHVHFLYVCNTQTTYYMPKCAVCNQKTLQTVSHNAMHLTFLVRRIQSDLTGQTQNGN